MKKILTQIFLKRLPFRKKTTAMPKKLGGKKKKTGGRMLPHESTWVELTEEGPDWLSPVGAGHQYSHRDDASIVVPSPMSVPPWSPRRYLPLEPLMATRPCSTNSRKKSSGFSASEHTRPLLETYQNLPLAPAVGWI